MQNKEIAIIIVMTLDIILTSILLALEHKKHLYWKRLAAETQRIGLDYYKELEQLKTRLARAKGNIIDLIKLVKEVTK